ncbi:MAG: hypothetical protein Q9163_001124 [Psora crenata]
MLTSSAIQVRDRLYFMGGTIKFNGDLTDQSHLYWLQLNESFPVDGVLKDYFLHTTSSFESQYLDGGTFWTDANETTLYLMIGPTNNNTDGRSNIKAYVPQYDTWGSINVSGGPSKKTIPRAGLYASSSDGGGSLSFIAGGEDRLPGLVTFNSSDPQHPSWTNVTDDVPYFWGPSTQYVRFGRRGVLVSVGGYVDFRNDQQREMSSVQVYDIDSRRWSQVLATGDIPRPRSEFCSVLSAAPDDSSFQLTIFGGWSQSENYALDDIYVLTMPAFHWIQIKGMTNTDANFASHVGRIRHSCHAYNDRQMIVLGGVVMKENIPSDISRCDGSYPVIKLLDTTTFQWQHDFPLPNATYQVPPSVYEVIGGGPKGGAKPANTWQSGSNLDIFSRTLPRYNPNRPMKALTATGTETGSSNSSSSSNDAGAIIAGVVGGVAGFFIIGALALVLISRRRKGQEEPTRWHKDNEAAKSNAIGMDAEAGRMEMEGWIRVEAPGRETAHELPA